MSRARFTNLSALPTNRHRIVWLTVVTALLALRFTPPNLCYIHDHQVLVKQSAAHDKRPCVQRADAEFAPSRCAISLVPGLSAFDFLRPDTSTQAREPNTCLYNRPPPLVA
jgi:hypothetical protein